MLSLRRFSPLPSLVASDVILKSDASIKQTWIRLSLMKKLDGKDGHRWSY